MELLRRLLFGLEVFQHPQLLRVNGFGDDLCPVRTDPYRSSGHCFARKVSEPVRSAAGRRHTKQSLVSRGVLSVIDKPASISRECSAHSVWSRNKWPPVTSRHRPDLN